MAASTGRILSWDEVRTAPSISVKFYVEHYIPVGGIVLIYGKYGTYKTPLTITLAAAIASGTSVFGLEVTKASPVLYVELDSPRPVIQPRIKAIPGSPGVALDFALVYPGFDIVRVSAGDPLGYATYLELLNAHREKQYKVVFVDALRGIHTEDDKESATPSKVYAGLAKLFPGATVVIIHHDKKTMPNETEEMKDESFSGSQAWINHATVGIKISHHNKRLKQIAMRHIKSQASELQPPLILRVKGGSDIELATKASAEDVEEAIKAYIEDNPTATAHEVDEAVAAGLGIGVRTVQRRRQEMGLGAEDLLSLTSNS